MLKHIVMWKFLETAEEKSRQENMDLVRDRLLALKTEIPELLSMEIGQDIGAGRDTYDMILMTSFLDADALERYQQHPAHKAISQYVAKVRSSRACVDFLTEC